MNSTFFFYDDQPLQDRATSRTPPCRVNPGYTTPSQTTVYWVIPVLESSTHEANQLSYPVWETYFHNKNEKIKTKLQSNAFILSLVKSLRILIQPNMSLFISIKPYWGLMQLFNIKFLSSLIRLRLVSPRTTWVHL